MSLLCLFDKKKQEIKHSFQNLINSVPEEYYIQKSSGFIYRKIESFWIVLEQN